MMAPVRTYVTYGNMMFVPKLMLHMKICNVKTYVTHEYEICSVPTNVTYENVKCSNIFCTRI